MRWKQTTKWYKWRMGNGVEIFIRDMSDSHLINSIRLCERMADDIRNAIQHHDFPEDSMAAYMMDQQFDIGDDMRTDEDLVPKLSELLKEAKKRGLQVEGMV